MEGPTDAQSVADSKAAYDARIFAETAPSDFHPATPRSSDKPSKPRFAPALSSIRSHRRRKRRLPASRQDWTNTSPKCAQQWRSRRFLYDPSVGSGFTVQPIREPRALSSGRTSLNTRWYRYHGIVVQRW